MQAAARLALVLAVGGTLHASPTQAQGTMPARPHLYELISREPYRSTWNRLIAPVLKNDRWLKGARGVWVPLQPVALNGVRVNIYVLCKPTGCVYGKISAIFAADGHRAYGAFRNATGTQILGSPPLAEHKALLAALH
ncbi:Ivy family c-type lysozyme inhibitor [Ancylobacter defluvii]|uniref:Inhibitor of lysozyme (Ivy) n=1 Tax=Ancylobacter defluvii TaxID=1282440 RepID=A0A9W6N919_9HYPH|nr:Ivy family c-type lysozyme inhibitor [Ancylobacter defluvii]MBS7587313.1 hypothetical protein [Ancylobacter defluvii]GLK82002.1 hypothetical protein GCM10017653_00710 [Ancylobacter defluvii]